MYKIQSLSFIRLHTQKKEKKKESPHLQDFNPWQYGAALHNWVRPRERYRKEGGDFGETSRAAGRIHGLEEEEERNKVGEELVWSSQIRGECGAWRVAIREKIWEAWVGWYQSEVNCYTILVIYI